MAVSFEKRQIRNGSEGIRKKGRPGIWLRKNRTDRMVTKDEE